MRGLFEGRVFLIRCFAVLSIVIEAASGIVLSFALTSSLDTSGLGAFGTTFFLGIGGKARTSVVGGNVSVGGGLGGSSTWMISGVLGSSPN